MTLQLVDIARDLSPITPAVLYEVAAAKYVKIDIATFRELVRSGHIPARRHPGRSRLIYLKSDLDSFLSQLEIVDMSRGKIKPGEVSTKPHLIGAVNA